MGAEWETKGEPSHGLIRNTSIRLKLTRIKKDIHKIVIG